MPSPSPRQIGRRNKGFSVTEILVVLLIISFSATMALLAYSNYRKGASVQASAQKISSAIVQAKTRAIANNFPSQVVFDLDRDSFWVDDLDRSGAIRAPKVVAPEALADFVIFESVQRNSSTFTTGLVEVVFQPDGTNPLVTVHLRREFDDASVDENFFSVQVYPSSQEPKIWARAKR